MVAVRAIGALVLALALALAPVLTLTLASFEEDCHHDRLGPLEVV